MPTDINTRSSFYFIAQAQQRCESCTELTPVVGFILPVGHETLEVSDGLISANAADGTWELASACAIVFDIEYLCDSIQERVQQFAPHFRIATDKSTAQSIWMNHCAFCGQQQADSALHCEPEGAFMPTSPEAAAAILMNKVREPFAAQVGGYAYSPEFLERARCTPEMNRDVRR